RAAGAGPGCAAVRELSRPRPPGRDRRARAAPAAGARPVRGGRGAVAGAAAGLRPPHAAASPRRPRPARRGAAAARRRGGAPGRGRARVARPRPRAAAAARPVLMPETVADEAGTARVAAALATTLHAGDVVHLVGELGAGKTTFVRHAAAAL